MAEVLATPRRTLADVRTAPVKATLRTQSSATGLREVAAEALRRCTTQKSAAIDMQIDEGHLSRQLKDGSMTLARLEVLGDAYCAEFGALLLERFADARESPRERARRLLPELVSLVLEATAMR